MHGGLYAYQLERKLHGKIEEVTNGKREGEREREKNTGQKRGALGQSHRTRNISSPANL